MTERRSSNQPGRLTILAIAVCLLAATLLARPAGAQEGIRESILTGFTQEIGPKKFVATLGLVGTPRSRLILLRHPDRVAIDLFDTVSALKQMSIEANPLVEGVREGLVAADRYRIVFALKQPGLPVASLDTKDGQSALKVTITATDASGFARAVASQDFGASIPPVTVPAAAPGAERVTIVLDPGHGGVDTGAVGRHGTLEKDINLQFARSLREALKHLPNVDVAMTRDDDSFVSLGQRSELARRSKAALFISLHADSIRYADIRGATVYTLSEKASDQLSREVAESENSSDRFVDPRWQDSQPEVFDILIELMRRETDSFSEHFAAGLVQEFGRHKVRLIRNPKRSAGFKVLVAPDVPSVLVELGYLSNIDDEQLLLDPSWREDTAAAIASAVSGYLGERGLAASAEPDKAEGG
ncbi:N-acetylmuramoyl-L-alanine amidase [Aureimonas glaciei]|uniref:N-acetylmuramoyl-L-alanine amidase n=1 Tax=Aureimonas glaciei TaxID=1776957 RepID=A0A916Y1K5_9HYPH|nr:N-acetylmuramoyl-L-alanine amidase [Aureimonas glaciei]GGD25462.1 N-acetylmuramoyl-L-alanine amidase [Aureimonas glaciei]